MKDLANPLINRAVQPYLYNLENYQPAPTRSISTYYNMDTTVESKPTALATTESQKTFGSSFSAGFGDAVSAPYDATFDFLWSATGVGGPNAMSIGVLFAVPSVAVAVISLPISVPCGIVKGLVQGFETLVGTQIPKL